MKELTKEQADRIFYQLAVEKRTYKSLQQEYGMNSTTLCNKMKTYKSFYGMDEEECYGIKTYLRFYHLEEILKKYKEGVCTKDLERYYPASERTFAELIQENSDLLRPRGVPSRTDQSIFSEITNEVEAYTVGLLTADGNISTTGSVAIDMISTDEELLCEINKRLYHETGHLFQYGGGEDSWHKIPMSRLIVHGKQLCQNLAKYNVIPNKTYSLEELYPFKDKEIMRHYLRGLFDGDGVVSQGKCKYLSVGYCAHNKSFTKSFQDFFCSKLDLPSNKLFNTGNCWDCRWAARKDVEKFYNFLYTDSSIYLKRKKEKIQNYLQGNTEVTS